MKTTKKPSVKVSATKESAEKALELLEDQEVFLPEETVAYLKRFLKAAAKVLPSEVCDGKDKVHMNAAVMLHNVPLCGDRHKDDGLTGDLTKLTCVDCINTLYDAFRREGKLQTEINKLFGYEVCQVAHIGGTCVRCGETPGGKATGRVRR